MNLKPLIIANWKMNGDAEFAVDYIDNLIEYIEPGINSEIIICPPHTLIELVASLCSDQIKIGAQDCSKSSDKTGAYTGEVSSFMLKKLGCSYVILGHSERRKFASETDEIIRQKLVAATKIHLTPIICIGETREELDNAKTYEVLEAQLKGALTDFSSPEIVIAYEPVWAIGTGRAISSKQLTEIVEFIQRLTQNLVEKSPKIIYGGSVKAENIHEILSIPGISGLLVGGASLKIEDFIEIINVAENLNLIN